MARKCVWLSWLPVDSASGSVRETIQALSRSGLEVDGLGWDRDLTRFGWLQTVQALTNADKVDVWLIAGDRADFDVESVRYGLSLASATLLAKRGAPLTILIGTLDAAPDDILLPSLLTASKRLGPPSTRWGAKTVAAAMRSADAQVDLPFRLNTIAHPSLGCWFEIGPREQQRWQGALFGVDVGEITHHGVGASGALPEQCTLEYPLQGLRIDASGREFVCWAVKNTLEPGQSYYVRVVGSPSAVLVGEYLEQDQADVRILDLV